MKDPYMSFLDLLLSFCIPTLGHFRIPKFEFAEYLIKNYDTVAELAIVVPFL